MLTEQLGCAKALFQTLYMSYFTAILCRRYYYYPILKMRQMRHGEVKKPAQSNTGSLPPGPALLFTLPVAGLSSIQAPGLSTFRWFSFHINLMR